MSYFKFEKLAAVSLRLFSAVLVLSLMGCEGGMIGTSTGPAVKPYELENLPDRISPDIPKTLLKGEELTPLQTDELNKDMLGYLTRYRDASDDKSEGWLELHFELSIVAYLRLNVESNTTIIDLAFDDIRRECADQLLDCTIPSDRIRVKITQDVVNRLINLNTEWAESVSKYFLPPQEGEDIIELINNKYTSLLNKEVVLGETHYSQLDGAPYDHSIRTSLKRGADKTDGIFIPRWQDEDFYVRWHEDGDVAKFVTNSADLPIQEYFYQNNVPSELVVVNAIDSGEENEGLIEGSYAKVIGNNPDDAGILLEVAAKGASYSTSSESTASTADNTAVSTGGGSSEDSLAGSDSLDGAADQSDGIDSAAMMEFDSTTTSVIEQVYKLFQGQLNNDGGYSSLDERFYDLTENRNLTFYFGYRESYDRIGGLLAGEQCNVAITAAQNDTCAEDAFDTYGPEGATLADSAQYFKPDEFDSLAAQQDSIRWKIEGLPADVIDIAVVSADTTTALPDREILCRGMQYLPTDAHIFCTATDEQLDNTVVVELVNSIASQVLPTAKLVQIQ